MTPECNTTNYSDGKVRELKTTTMVEVSLMLLLLVLIIFGNGVLYLHTKKYMGSRKDRAAARLWRALSLVGATSGLLQICGQLATKFNGGWFLGDAVCQVYALFTCTFISWWIWLLVCVSFEKYFHKFHQRDHPTLFSRANLLIIVWGSGLVVFAVYMGPMYGWAEYSPYWGSLDIHVSVVQNLTAGLTQTDTDNAGRVLSFFANASDTVAIGGLQAFFSSYYGKVNVRRGTIQGSTLHLSLQFLLQRNALCFLENWSSGVDYDALQFHLLARHTYGMHLHQDVKLNIDIQKKNIQEYTTVYLPYQGKSSCHLDYTHVNKHAVSFMAMHIITAEVLPYGVMVYLFIRYASLQRSHCAGLRRRMSLIERVETYTALAIGSTKPLTYTVIFTFIGYNVYVITCIIAGYGISFPPILLTVSYMFLYLSYLVPYVTFCLHTRSILLYGEGISLTSPLNNPLALAVHDDNLEEIPFDPSNEDVSYQTPVSNIDSENAVSNSNSTGRSESARYEKRKSSSSVRLSIDKQKHASLITQKRNSYQRATDESVI